MSTNDIVDEGGAPALSGALPDSERSAENPIQSTFLASTFSQGPVGMTLLTENEQADRAAQYKSATGQDLNDTYSFPDLPAAVAASKGTAPTDGLIAGQMNQPGSLASVYYGFPNVNKNLLNQIEVEKKVEAYNAQNPDKPLPTAQDIYKTVHDTAADMDSQQAYDTEHTSGVTPSIFGYQPFGKVTGPGLIGGALAPQNLGTMLVPGAGGIGATVVKRVASAFAVNAGVAAATQFALVRSQREGEGLDFDPKAAAFNSLAAGVFGGTMSALHEAGKAVFPGTTPQAAKDLSGKLNEVAATNTPVGNLASEIKAAATPDEAAAAMTAAPLATKSDLLNAIDENPPTNMRGGMQAMERENVAESLQPENMPWQEHIDRAQNVNDALENNKPMPNYDPTTSTHIDDALNQIRAEDAAATTASGGEPPSLAKFIADRGGVIDKDGEIAQFDGDVWHRDQPFQKRLVTEDDGLGAASPHSLEKVTEAAYEAGYFHDMKTKPTPDDLVDRLHDEVAGGEKQLPQHENVETDHGINTDNLRGELKKAGVDLQTQSNSEAWAALNKNADEYRAQHEQELYEDAASQPDTVAAREADLNNKFDQIRQMAEEAHANIGPDTHGLDELTTLGDMHLDEDGNLKGGMTLREALQSIKDDENLHKAMTSCLTK